MAAFVRRPGSGACSAGERGAAARRRRAAMGRAVLPRAKSTPRGGLGSHRGGRRPVRLPGRLGVARDSSMRWERPGRSGCGCGALRICGCGRCARSPSSGRGPAPSTARTSRPCSARGSPSGAGWWSPAPPTGSTAPRTGARSPRAAPPSPCSPAGSTVAYPSGHAELIGRIAEQGLVIGELPPGDHPTRSRFILRNRVIAALTRGTVVVEAALPQRLAGHRPARADGWAGSRWGSRARSPAGSRRECTNCCAGRRRGHRCRRSHRAGREHGRAGPATEGARAAPGPAGPGSGARSGRAAGREAPPTPLDSHRLSAPPRTTARYGLRTVRAGLRRTARRRLAVEQRHGPEGGAHHRVMSRSLTWGFRVKG